MKYTDLIFDLYGTLVDIHTDQTKDEVWEKTALYFGFHGARYSADELKAEFERLTQREETALTKASVSGAFQAYECFPELKIDQIFEELFRQKGVSENAASLAVSAAHVFRLVSMEYIRLYPHVKEALALLRQKGFRLWLLSNAQHVFTAHEIRCLGLEDCFDGVYLSSDYSCRKPDKRFFDRLLTEQKIDKGHALMIGNDLTADIGGAKTAGLHGFYVCSNLSPDADKKALSGTMDRHPQPDYIFDGTDWSKIADRLLRVSEI